MYLGSLLSFLGLYKKLGCLEYKNLASAQFVLLRGMRQQVGVAEFNISLSGFIISFPSPVSTALKGSPCTSFCTAGPADLHLPCPEKARWG